MSSRLNPDYLKRNLDQARNRLAAQTAIVDYINTQRSIEQRQLESLQLAVDQAVERINDHHAASQ